MTPTQIPVLGFVATSGTGKTTLLSQVIPLLKNSGLKIGVIKHSHHNFELDHPGKDSFRLRHAGADSTIIVSRYRRAIITEFSDIKEPELDEQIKLFTDPIDLILVEGFKQAPIPKIEVHRVELGNPLLYIDDPHIIAVASDRTLDLPEHLIQLNINNPHTVASFIQHLHFGFYDRCL